MTALYLEGSPPVATHRTSSPPTSRAPWTVALQDLQPGDVVAMMCIETGPQSRGAR